MSLSSSELIAAFERRFFSRLTELLQSVNHTSPIAIAYSGGLDSTVLLHLLTSFRCQHALAFFAIHVHHGLSSHADEWLAHCQSYCMSLGVTCEVEKVKVNSAGLGIEAAARRERYRAIGRVCKRQGARLVLTAHHIDDQAETVLMQLVRGSGVRGLAGMDEINFAPSLFDDDAISMARPLLKESRQTLQAYAEFYGLLHIDDESNQSPDFMRNALRIKVMPQLEMISFGFAERVARTAHHMREANLLLEEMAAEDLSRAMQDDGSLCLTAFVGMSCARLNNVFRFWLVKNAIQLPSTAKLEEIRRQLLDAREDARIQIHHDGVMLSRYQDKLFVVHGEAPRQDEAAPQMAQTIVWNGEESLAIEGFSGRLYFRESEYGIAVESLKGQVLECRLRAPGLRLRLARNRPSRDMKSHFQTAGIPFWRRDQLPFIYLNQRLLYVAELGIDAAFLDEQTGPKISLEWKAE